MKKYILLLITLIAGSICQVSAFSLGKYPIANPTVGIDSIAVIELIDELLPIDISEFKKFTLNHTSLHKKISFIHTYTLDDILFENSSLKVSTIYPNPASAFASINYNVFEAANASISLTNVLGNSMGEFVLDESEGKITVPTSKYESGIYFYTLILNGQPVATKKLIVKHQ